MKVCLDAGHSLALDTGGDPGAVNGIYRESIAALSIVLKIGKLLEDSSHIVYYTRTGGRPHLSLSFRCGLPPVLV